MYRISRFFPYLFVHFLLGLVASFAYVFFMPIKETVLPVSLFSWKIRESILLFIFYFPFIYTSALIFAYPIIFGKFGPAKMQRRSSAMIRFIQHFFIFSLAVLSFYVVLAEAVKPILMEYQSRSVYQALTHKEYTKLAKEAYDRNDYSQAGDHIGRALSIWPQSEDAMKLNEMIKIAGEKLSLDKTDSVLRKNISEEDNISMTAEAALKRAEMAALAFDFYTAHYYAKLAMQTFQDGNPLKIDAENLAVQAWAEVEKGLASYKDAPSIALYKSKKAAYEALQRGDYIKAYYSFLQIDSSMRASNPDKKDPEVERFLNLSRVELEKNVFFTDELKNIPNFIMRGDISFTVGEHSHECAVIKIHGISHGSSTLRNEIYLMNVLYTRLGISNAEKWSIIIPYAKLIEVVDDEGKNRLMLQICSVDRYSEEKNVYPKVLSGELPRENAHNILLPMTMTDFILIEKSISGPSAMKISDLYYFSLIAEKYGLKKEAYLSEVLYRLTEPLLLLIVSLLVLILAWRFRVSPGRRLNKRLFLFSPLCPFLSYILMETLRYIFKLQIAFFVCLTPRYVSLIVFGLPVIALIFLIITLVYQRSE
ncbi:hypothetical protein [Treponema denticola]|jgi:hypothetical protein|uniref:Uncharacterized protein n=1 Tax=Treponema denticola H1-T TaxID=999431 RepID=M2AXQ3_TREDN|nr:hypothetical protein [Treponema denticola]EMB27492.1 hypothetical protein HMPREF9727_02208 [Treponema denticola MYR-T]EMB28131.1 hypothetical protein HMPREF9725_02561 [Treponema denticola H1-T]EMB38443.1 hypothetical protein HMPREF9722_02323 [Treponema denticola ATCC 33520]UTC85727.1 hypothetical protein E4N91_08840 [Treponema denticola]